MTQEERYKHYYNEGYNAGCVKGYEQAIKDACEWLEKQGEEEHALKSSRDEDIHKFMQYIEKQAKAYEFNLPNRGYDIYAFAKDILYWLEKQGVQKPADNSETELHEGDWIVINETVYQITEIDDSHVVLSFNGRECKFELDVLNNAQKFESQFKVGDWITDGRLTCKVLSAIGKSYELHLYNDDYCHFETDIQSVDKYYHLWTIQDAEDGDVLINWNNTTFIFRAIEDETVKFHIAYNEKWDTIKTPSTKLSHLGLPESQFEFHPATKEQRDLLFSKMKETGYEWDSEKKELKKIEPK